MKEKKRRREDFGNRVPMEDRWFAALIFLGTLAVGYHALMDDGMFFPGKPARWYRSGTPDVHMHGWAVYWMFLALANVALVALSFVLDHYDRRFNAGFYFGLRRALLAACVVCIAVGIGAHLTT